MPATTAKIPAPRYYWLTKTDSGWKRIPCLTERVHGDSYPKVPAEYASNGRFQTREQVNGKTVWRNLTDGWGRSITSPILARDAALRLQKAVGVRLHQTMKTASDELYTVYKAVDAYETWLKDKGRDEALLQAKQVLGEFLGVCRKASLPIARITDICEEHLRAYMSVLEDDKKSLRTMANKYDRVIFWLNWVNDEKYRRERKQANGRYVQRRDYVDTKLIRESFPAPEYDKDAPVTTYSKGQLDSIMEAADPYMVVVLHLGLYLGLRMQEIKFACWSDVHWHSRTFSVQSKADLSFRVKAKHGRTMPIPANTLQLLEEWKEQHPDTRLIVGTASDRPNKHLLRALKRMARSAGLNCGHCDGCQKAPYECREFGLHKLRRTYATALIRTGADYKTVGKYVGHRDPKTTKRYIEAVRATSKAAHKLADSLDFGD